MNDKWQWGQVGWTLAGHRDGLSSSIFSLILNSSVGLSAGIQSVRDWISETLWVRILHSAEEDNLSPFDSKHNIRLSAKGELYSRFVIITKMSTSLFIEVHTEFRLTELHICPGTHWWLIHVWWCKKCWCFTERNIQLTHLPLVPHLCVNEPGHHRLK